MNGTYEDVVEALASEPDVTVGTGFGANPGLRVQDKIFSMLLHDELVVKLPGERCEELVAGGAAYLRMGTREMRQWVSVADGDWVALSREALEFVRPG